MRAVVVCLALLAQTTVSFTVPTRSINRNVFSARGSHWVKPTSVVALGAEASEATSDASAEDDSTPALESSAEDTGASSGEDAPKKLELSDLVLETEVEGVVKAVSSFGAFVDIGAVSDGLVHKSELANQFVEDPAAFVSVGDKVNVRVIRVDPDAGRISLSMKAPREQKPRRSRQNQDLSKYEALSAQEFISGKVKTVASYGAFIELEEGVTGLCHISQLAEGRVESVESAVSVGDAVQVRVKEVKDGKISLSMAPYKENEGARQSRGEGGPRKPRQDDGPPVRKRGDERVEDIWSDSTEPNWQQYVSELSKDADEFTNTIELRL